MEFWTYKKVKDKKINLDLEEIRMWLEGADKNSDDIDAVISTLKGNYDKDATFKKNELIVPIYQEVMTGYKQFDKLHTLTFQIEFSSEGEIEDVNLWEVDLYG
jgi:hypothetical protein